MPKLKLNFFQQSTGHIVYGIVLLVLTIVFMLANTFIIQNRYSNVLEVAVQRHSYYVAKIFTSTAYKDLDNYEELQNKLNVIQQNNTDVVGMDILAKKGEGFEVVASFQEEKIGNDANDTNYILSWAIDDGISYRVPDFRRGYEDNKLWEVVMPVRDYEGNKKLLLVIYLSYSLVQEVEDQAYIFSTIVLIATTLVISLLLLLNLRFFEYAILLKRLKSVDQMKDEFISIASHELRTPITTIKGFLSMLLEGDFGDLGDEGKKTLKIMDSSVKRLGSLVEDLLNVSRIEQNRLKLSPEKMNLVEALNNIGDEFKLRAEEKGLKLILSVPEDLPDIYADPDKLTQVMVNLVGNSVKYTKKGEVEIIAKQTDNKFINITIKDTGIGMTAKEREQLFSKFYRIQGEETKGIVGTGLGLWITKQLVELMGGEIFVDSIKHVGSQFYFTVPIYSSQGKDETEYKEEEK